MSLNKVNKKHVAFYYYNKSDTNILNDGDYKVVGIGDTVHRANLYSYLQEEHMVRMHEYAHLFHEDINLKPSYFMIPATTVGVSFCDKKRSRADVFNNPNRSYLQQKVNFHQDLCAAVYEISDINKNNYNTRVEEVVHRVLAQ